MFRILLLGFLSLIILIGGIFFFTHLLQVYFPYPQPAINLEPLPPTAAPTPTPIVIQPAGSKSLSGVPFVYQTFNNCGPAALSMDLAYYGIDVSQQDLANILRPYNNPQGYNDDKSVALEEFEPVVKNYRLIFYSRPNGTVNLVKLFLANGIPVLTRTWLKEDDYSQKSSAYIGHFRILTGFDDTAQEFIQMDSIEGSRRFSYSQFLRLWQPFNYEYAVIAPPEKEGAIRAILGPEESPQVAWSNAKQRAQDELKTNPQSLYSNFNLSVAYYSLGQYQDSVQTFSKIRQRLPIKMLWYQLEPVLTYQQTKDYPEVFTLTDQIFQSGNPAFAEAYIVRGDAYLAQGNKEAARREYQKAYLYNQNLPLAKEKLL